MNRNHFSVGKGSNSPVRTNPFMILLGILSVNTGFDYHLEVRCEFSSFLVSFGTYKCFDTLVVVFRYVFFQEVFVTVCYLKNCEFKHSNCYSVSTFSQRRGPLKGAGTNKDFLVLDIIGVAVNIVG